MFFLYIICSKENQMSRNGKRYGLKPHEICFSCQIDRKATGSVFRTSFGDKTHPSFEQSEVRNTKFIFLSKLN